MNEIKVTISAKGILTGNDEIKKDLASIQVSAQKTSESIAKAAKVDFTPLSKSVAKTKREMSELEVAISGTFDSFGDTVKNAFAIFSAGYIVNSVKNFFSESISAAQDLESALKGVKTVAVAFGRDTAQVQKAVQDFTADGLVTATESAAAFKQILSTGTDLPTAIRLLNSLKDAAAFNRQSFYGLGEAIVATTEGIKNNNSVKADAVGITKNISVLQKEYAASIGKTIGELTDEQKVLAAVTGFIREGAIFTGDAARVTETYTGKVAKLDAAFLQLKQSIGQGFTESKTLAAVLDELTSGAKAGKQSGLSQVVDNVALGFLKVGDIIVRVGDAILGIKPLILSAISIPLSFAGRVAEEVFNKISGKTSTFFKDLNQELVKQAEENIKNITQVFSRDTGFAALSRQIKKDMTEGAKSTNDNLKGVKQNLQNITQIENERKKEEKERLKAEKEALKIRKDTIQELNAELKLMKDLRDEFGQGFNNPLQSLLGGTDLVKSLRAKLKETFGDPEIRRALETAEKNSLIGTAGGLANSVLQGAAGAKGVVVGLAKGFADQFLPGLGQVVGPLVEALASGPDAVREQVRQFAQALPEILKNIALAIPAVIDEVAKQVGPIIESLSAAMPEVARSLAAQSPMIALEISKATAFEMPKAILKGAPEMAKAFSVALVQGAGDFIKELKNKLTGGGSNLVSKATGGQSFFSAAKNAAAGSLAASILGPAGAIGGAIGGFIGKLKFAEGGSATYAKSVPGGFNNDTFPARLSSGELVVDRSTAFKLKKALDDGNVGGGQDLRELQAMMAEFLNEMRNGKPIQIINKLGEREVSKFILNLNQSGARLT